jgi:hypothetical protein
MEELRCLRAKVSCKRSQVKRFPAESGVQGCLPAYAFADRPACAMHLSACGHAQAGADRPLSN